MEATAYGSPARRERQWFYVVPVENPINQLAKDWEPPARASEFLTITMIMRIGKGFLARFLLPETDERLATWLGSETARHEDNLSKRG
eukprot:12523063-Alexandrium_andersonii.AAC.1